MRDGDWWVLRARHVSGGFTATGWIAWNRTVHGKLAVAHLLYKFPAFCGTRRFVAVFTRSLDPFLFFEFPTENLCAFVCSRLSMWHESPIAPSYARVSCRPVTVLFGPLSCYLRGTRWRSWLRHCATSRKLAGSTPDGVTGIFH